MSQPPPPPGLPPRRSFLAAAAAAAAAGPAQGLQLGGRRAPNFIIVLCDDLGFGDTSLYGASAIRTPALERMAREGVLLTDYYAPANICTPSRAGLLTGRYPVRTGLGYEVIMQAEDRGLPGSEMTIAQALKPAGYASGLFGKWHLGHRSAGWPPTRHGFDRFFGIPYSHDMTPLALFAAEAGRAEVKSEPAVLPQLQQRFYAEAERFIAEHRDRPFFVELALSAPHLPEHPHAPFDPAGRAGPYGAVVAEIDDLVDRLLRRLRELRLDRETVVVFTSDNGPWFEGSPGPFRDRKGGSGYEGGYRVPFVGWAPGRIPAGRTVSSMTCGIDLLPTFCAMAGAPLPAGVRIDGRDVSAVWTRGAPSPHEALILFDNEDPVAVRTQRWKYVAAGHYRGLRLPFAAMGYDELYDLEADRSESYSVAASHPDVAAALKRRLAAARAEFAAYKSKEIPAVFREMRERLARQD